MNDVARYPSPDEAARHLRELKIALAAVRDGAQPPAEALGWPAGLERSIMARLPLPERTRRAVRLAGLTRGHKTGRRYLARYGRRWTNSRATRGRATCGCLH